MSLSRGNNVASSRHQMRAQRDTTAENWTFRTEADFGAARFSLRAAEGSTPPLAGTAAARPVPTVEGHRSLRPQIKFRPTEAAASDAICWRASAECEDPGSGREESTHGIRGPSKTSADRPGVTNGWAQR
jgi:hypothetical protein